MSEEQNFSFTTKVNGDLFTVRGSNAQEFRQNLAEVGNLGLGAEITAMVTAANNTAALNGTLGAMPVDSPQNQDTPQWGERPQQAQPPQAQSAPPQQGQSPWASSEPPQAQQAQPQWGGQQGFQQQPSAGGDKPWLYNHEIQPPHLEAPVAPDGRPFVYKSGISGKTGKPWRAFMPPQKDMGLDPVWIRDKDL